MIHVRSSKIIIALVSMSLFFVLVSWYMYRALYHDVVTVVKLKQQYADHVLTYRKLITAAQAYEDADEDECSFDAVNRDFAYLRESALDYAKDHQLENRISTIYDPEWVNRSIADQRQRSNQRTRQRSTRTRTYATVPSAYRSELALHVPVDPSRFWLSSRFGPRKDRHGGLKMHQGIDMAALQGTPVKAAAAGTVVESSSSPYGYGNCVVIQHSQKYKTRYAHLDTIKVNKGDKVSTGQLIGTVGSTGSVRGVNGGKNASHLHFEVMVYGNRIDPLQMLR